MNKYYKITLLDDLYTGWNFNIFIQKERCTYWDYKKRKMFYIETPIIKIDKFIEFNFKDWFICAYDMDRNMYQSKGSIKNIKRMNEILNIFDEEILKLKNQIENISKIKIVEFNFDDMIKNILKKTKKRNEFLPSIYTLWGQKNG
jgi:hypothetical protein